MFLDIREACVLVTINNDIWPIFDRVSTMFYELFVKVDDVVGARLQESNTVFDT